MTDTEKIEKIRDRIKVLGLRKDLSVKSKDILDAMMELTLNEIVEEIGSFLWCIRDIRDIVEGSTDEIEIKDCHYCNWCMCIDENDDKAACYVEDNGYFSHDITDPKEAETCPDFIFCDSFPKC